MTATEHACPEYDCDLLAGAHKKFKAYFDPKPLNPVMLSTPYQKVDIYEQAENIRLRNQSLGLLNSNHEFPRLKLLQNRRDLWSKLEK